MLEKVNQAVGTGKVLVRVFIDLKKLLIQPITQFYFLD